MPAPPTLTWGRQAPLDSRAPEGSERHQRATKGAGKPGFNRDYKENPSSGANRRAAPHCIHENSRAAASTMLAHGRVMRRSCSRAPVISKVRLPAAAIIDSRIPQGLARLTCAASKTLALTSTASTRIPAFRNSRGTTPTPTPRVRALNPEGRGNAYFADSITANPAKAGWSRVSRCVNCAPMTDRPARRKRTPLLVSVNTARH